VILVTILEIAQVAADPIRCLRKVTCGSTRFRPRGGGGITP